MLSYRKHQCLIMIRIECQKENGKIKSLSLKGHAQFAQKGKDIVCSAVSAVVIGGINALENPKAFNINVDEEKGEILIEEIKDVQTHDYIVLETILIQLKSIEEVANKNVQIIEKGC